LRFDNADGRIRHFLKVEVNKELLGQAKKESLEKIVSSKIAIPNYEGLAVELPENHFYLPLLRASDGISPKSLNWIKHIVKNESETAFLKELKENGRHLSKFDWWAFSKIDESLDKGVGIPYYKEGKELLWHPDFIIWLQRGENYFIVFVDPKGTAHTDYQIKLDYAKLLFENGDGTPKTFRIGKRKAKIYALLYSKGEAQLPQEYKKYWIRSVKELADKLETG